MPGLLLWLVVCHAQGGMETGCAHRAKARFWACTFVRFARGPFTERRRRGVLRRLHEWKPGLWGKEGHEQLTSARQIEGGYG